MPRPGFCMRKGISLHRRQALFPLVSAFWAGARGGARVAGRAAPVQHRGVQAGGTLGCSAAEMRRRRAVLGRIGLAGALPFDQYRLLAGQVPEVVDLNAACTGLRLVKSGQEMAALRRGAALSDAAITALAGALRPGATDHQVLAATEQAYT